MPELERPERVSLQMFFGTTFGAVLVVGIFGGLISLLHGGRHANSTIALVYYALGSIVVIVGCVPTGGVSLVRGRQTPRRPGGSSGYAVPSLLLGLVLIGVGSLIDIYKPF